MLQKLRLVIDQLNDRAADPRSGLNEVIQEITSQTFELLNETFEPADFFVYAVMFPGDQRARLIAAAPAQIFSALIQTIAQSETGGLTYLAFQTKQTQNIPNITLAQAEAQAEAQADIIHDPQTRAQLSLPLRLASGRVIAVISIEHHQINAFTADLQEILELLAEYAATAIQSKINLRSFDVLQGATHRLNNTLSIDVKQILDVLAEESVRVLQSLYTDVVFSHIALVRGRRLEFFVAYSGLPEEDVHQLLREKVNDVIDLDNPPQGKIGIIGRVVLNNKPQNVPDVRQDTDYIQLAQTDHLQFVELRLVLPNPLDLLAKGNEWTTEVGCLTHLCTTHGDFNANNILVNLHHQEAWLIDFHRTEVEHALRDFIQLESVIKLILLTQASLAERYALEQALLAQERFSQIQEIEGAYSPPDNEHGTELGRAFSLICTIRRLARACVCKNNLNPMIDDFTPYHMGMLFYALNTMRFIRATSTSYGVDEVSALHSLMLAGLICQKLNANGLLRA